MTTRTTYTPPRLIDGEWVVTRQEWLNGWLLVQYRNWFKGETLAWTYFNNHSWDDLADRLKAETST